MATPSESRASPTVFICYAWEDADDSAWVKALATRMRTEDGLNVTLDVWGACPGDELPHFMEKAVRESDFVLLVCTPVYKAKFDERIRGVGYEARLIAAEMFTQQNARKFISVHRKDDWTKAAPSVVLGNYYVDLCGEPYAEARYRSLIEALWGREELPPPLNRSVAVFEGPDERPAHSVPHFCGREEELEALTAHLLSNESTAVCVVASGIGGVGKTVLAQQFVATVARKMFPDGTAWLDATKLPTELVRVAKRYKWAEEQEPTPEVLVRWLEHHLRDRAILLVVDNVPTDGIDLNHLPFPGGRCRTILTSRSAQLHEELRVSAQPLALKRWTPEACRAYLREVVPRCDKEPDADLDALCGFVEGLPLAVRLLSNLFRKRLQDPAVSLLAALEAQPLTTLESVAKGKDRGVAATFMTAYVSLSENEQRVLEALAACARRTRVTVVAAVAGMDEPRVADALNVLFDNSLVEFAEETDASWGLHDVLRMFVHHQPGQGDAAAVHLRWVEAQMAEHADPLAHAAFERGLDEMEVAVRRLVTNGHGDRASEVFHPLFLHLTQRGHLGRAVSLGTRVLDAAPSDGHTAATWFGNLGLCYRTLGDIRKAIDFHRRSLSISENLGRLESQANQLGNLGLCYLTLGDITEAIDFLDRSLCIHKEIGSLEGQAGALGNLGLCYQTQRNIRKAIRFHKRSLSIEKRLAGQAIHLGNLGVCYQTLGNIDKAIHLHKRALSIDENIGRLEGQAADLGNLGLCYHTLGDIPTAIGFLKRSLSLEEKLGRLEGQANQLENLGLCYQTLGDISTAIEFLECSLSFFGKMQLPEDHASLMRVRNALDALRR